MIRIVSSTRIHGTAAVKGSERRTSVGALVAAVSDLPDTLRLIRSHTDSAASAWIEVDGARVDVSGVQMATSTAEARAEARRILAGA